MLSVLFAAALAATHLLLSNRLERYQ
jgi:hypothetical protein